VIRTTRVLAPRFLFPLGLAAIVAISGCGQPAPAVDNSIPYDPARAKSQEDSMRKAMEESQKAARK
jgi:hypothetical protein